MLLPPKDNNFTVNPTEEQFWNMEAEEDEWLLKTGQWDDELDFDEQSEAKIDELYKRSKK
ncbi:hypothetical protein BKG93_06695 [Rodentibacter ratti]|uniref:Uncharacterized protein n=1 Tax=Rodentibacter ratti TaxID=1906745 RepID=A0A1V3L3Z0_9PAST|nr:hypothetical protein [Rodentibacter ratti]OOF84647.1 hypothetical protein BKG93_06695 [Rodentibacter ratti]